MAMAASPTSRGERVERFMDALGQAEQAQARGLRISDVELEERVLQAQEAIGASGGLARKRSQSPAPTSPQGAGLLFSSAETGGPAVSPNEPGAPQPQNGGHGLQHLLRAALEVEAAIAGRPGAKRQFIGSVIPERKSRSGETMKVAFLQRAALRVVPCIEHVSGSRMDGLTTRQTLGPHAPSQVKIVFLRFTVEELYFDPGFGALEKRRATLVGGLPRGVACRGGGEQHAPELVVLKVAGSEHEAERGPDGQLTLVLDVGGRQLPLEAQLSFEYESPFAGRRYVQEHPLQIAYTNGTRDGTDETRTCAIT